MHIRYFILLTTTLLLLTSPTFGETLREYLHFIPDKCCVTANCCFSVDHKDIIDLGLGQFQIKATGEVVNKTGDSTDGMFWRCACDYSYETKKYIINTMAKTNCLFAPNMDY